MLAVGSFSSLITFQGTAFVPHCRPPFTSLRSVHFSHLSTARHKWHPHSTPQINPSHSFALPSCNPCTNKSTHKQPVKLHFIPQPHCSVTLSRHLCLFTTHFQWSIFSHCDEFTPINRLKADRKVITPNRCVFQASPT